MLNGWETIKKISQSIKILLSMKPNKKKYGWGILCCTNIPRHVYREKSAYFRFLSRFTYLSLALAVNTLGALQW